MISFCRPFALLCLALLPFLGFGAEMEMKLYLGEDEGDSEETDQNSPGGIVVETLVNIRTVASLNIEDRRSAEFSQALGDEDPTPIKSNFIKGSATGLGQLMQMWGIGKACFFVFPVWLPVLFLTRSHHYFGCILLALLGWRGAWLLLNYPGSFQYRDFLFSMCSLLFGLDGIGVSMQGATDRDKAKLAAHRIFELTDRQSAIDPLTEEGKKDIPLPRDHERHISS
jgi:ATP-binding cassette, subfamily B (MDR/TAP), member 1